MGFNRRLLDIALSKAAFDPFPDNKVLLLREILRYSLAHFQLQAN